MPSAGGRRRLTNLYAAQLKAAAQLSPTRVEDGHATPVVGLSKRDLEQILAGRRFGPELKHATIHHEFTRTPGIGRQRPEPWFSLALPPNAPLRIDDPGRLHIARTHLADRSPVEREARRLARPRIARI